MTGRPTTTSIACTRCGGAIYAGDRFCGSCGAVVTNSQVPHTPTEGIGFTSFGGWDRIVDRLRAATVGEFEIRRELGRGGMAIVFLAQDLALRRKVAIKLMSPGLLTNEDMVRKFRDEAVTVAQMSHPNIISIYAVRAVEDLHFFIMKFVEGASIDKVLRDTGPMPFTVVRGILAQVGSALTYAHRRGVIHRDVKPANILIDVEGDASVTDFGIAKAVDSETFTKTGSVVGTPAYMSPEQCYALPATWSSDQYSLGVVAYEMVAGVPPFSGPSFAIMKAHADELPPPIRDVRPDCPPDLEAAILRMLAKTPDDRFPSIPQALAALNARPLHEDHPDRITLAALIRKSVPTAALTPVSPVPQWTRERAAKVEEEPPSVPTTSAKQSAAAPPSESPPPSSSRPADQTVLLSPRSEAPTVRLDAGPPPSPRPADTPAPAPIPAPAPETSGSARVRRRGLGVGALIVAAAAVFWFVVLRGKTLPGVGSEPNKADVAPVSPADSVPAVVQPAATQPGTAPESTQTATSPSATSTPPSATRADTAVATSTPRSEVKAPAPLPAPAKSIAVTPSELTLLIGQTVQPDVAVLGADKRPLPGRRVVWVSPNAAIATVDRATGVVTGVSVGTVDLSATSDLARGTLRVHVEAPVVLASVSVDQPGRLTVGENRTLSAVARDSRGNLMADQATSWASGNPAVATIGATSGIVTAVGPGTTDITATSGGKSTVVRLTVVAPPPPAESSRTPARDPAAEERAARAAVDGVVGQYVAALRAHDLRTVTSLYRPESDQDRKNEQVLRRLMEGSAKLTATEPTIGQTRFDGSSGSVDFTVPMSWRNPFGVIRQQVVTFRADLQRDASGWRIAGARIVGVLNP